MARLGSGQGRQCISESALQCGDIHTFQEDILHVAFVLHVSKELHREAAEGIFYILSVKLILSILFISIQLMPSFPSK